MAHSNNINNTQQSGDNEIRQFLSPNQTNQFSNRYDTGSPSTRLNLSWLLVAAVLAATTGSQLLLRTRFESFGGHCSPDMANQHAERGWFRDGLQRVHRCFHCDGGVENLDSKTSHSGHKHDCKFLHLQMYLEEKSSEPTAAPRLEKLTRFFFEFKLTDGVRTVLDYGYTKEQVLLAVLKYLIGLTGELITVPRPGDIIEQANLLSPETEIIGKQVLIPLIDKLTVQFADSSITAADSTTIRMDSIRSANEIFHLSSPARAQNSVTIAEIQQSYDVDNPMCAQCGTNQRDRLLLPCGHLRYCHRCVRTFTRCPVCGSVIVCEIPVYLC